MRVAPKPLGDPIRNDGGATAVEFALVVPVFVALLVGILNAGVMMFTVASLNYATVRAARCAAVNSTQCGDAASIISYATGSYYAIATPVFSYAAAACGKSVTGAVTFDFNAVIYSKSISLTSSACFP